MQVGSDEIAERSPKAIKRDFRALGLLVEGSGAQVVFSSVPSVAGKNTERNRKTHRINRWLRGWCSQRFFVFFQLWGGLHGTGPPGDRWSPAVSKGKKDSRT